MKTIRLLVVPLLLFSCSLRLFGENVPPGWVVGWGRNLSGQATGISDGMSSTGLVIVAGRVLIPYSTGLVTIAGQVLTNAVAISAGLSHGLALKADGTVVGWGNNMSGRAVGVETGSTNGLVMVDGRILNNVSAISACQYSLALQSNGAVVVWGRDGSGKPILIPDDFSNALSVAAGESYSLALKKDGTITTATSVGTKFKPIEFSNVVAVATATKNAVQRNLGLKQDGTVVVWNDNNGMLDTCRGLSNIVAIAAGANHHLALKNDGTVVEWGWVRNSETNVPVGLTNVVAIAASKADVMGYNGFSLALKNDGTVVAWGKFSNQQPVNVPVGLSNVVAIAAGDDFCLAITTNRAVAERFRH